LANFTAKVLATVESSTVGLLKAPFTFDGRIPRSAFWFYSLFGLVWVSPLLLFTESLFKNFFDVDPIEVKTVFIALYFCSITIVGFIVLAAHAKRWHDVGGPAWLALLGFIPIVNFFIFWFLGLAKGIKGPNIYGKDPL
jgi:uncharacterized membrane protein YhaH (DUF805 family)